MDFLPFSQEIFEVFHKNFPNNCVFRPKREKSAHGFLNFFETSSKIILFCYFLKKFLKIFSFISQRIMFFVKTRENLTQAFEIILEIEQNNAFCTIFKENLKVSS